MEKVKLGIIGCGNVSKRYFNSANLFDFLEVVGCTDLDLEKAKASAEQFGVPKVYKSTEELLKDPEVDLAVNLTVHTVHAKVSLAALEAGKHIHSEKPLATTKEDAQKILKLAKEKGLRVGCAPDTFLGGGLQACRKLIDKGAIGEPVAATAFFINHGMEDWHPNPEPFYQPGAGPMFDVGCYSLTALIHLVGTFKGVSSMAKISFPERIANSKERRGDKIKVSTPTHVAGTVEFKNGTIGTVITSHDIWGNNLPKIEIYGTEGSLSTPDPKVFKGAPSLYSPKTKEWTQAEQTHGYVTGMLRGLGMAEMGWAMLHNRPHRANGEMAYHVLDTMQAFLDSAEQGKRIDITSTCERPTPLPSGLTDGQFELQSTESAVVA